MIAAFKINRAKMAFSKTGDPFSGAEVSGYNCFAGGEANRIRKKATKFDVTNFISSDKPRFIYAKRNVEAIRR